MKNLRLGLKKSVSRDDVNNLAWQSGWLFHDLIPKSENAPYEKIWLTPDEQTAIHHIEDSLINIPYLLIEGKNQKEVISEICSTLNTYHREDIDELFQNAQARDEYIYAIYVAGVAAPPEYDSEFMKYFEKTMSNSEPDVRKAAIFATSYAGWQDFKKILQNLKKTDPDQSVRRFAEITLESLAKHSWKSDVD